MRAILITIALVMAARAQQTGAELQALEQSLLRAVKSSPTAENWQKLGLTRHLQNRFEDAILAFREAIRLDASLWPSHLFLGIGLYRTNEFSNALASLERANKLAPRGAPGRDDIDYWMAATNVALKQPLKAMRSLEALLQRNPKHIEALELATRTYSDVSTALWNEVADRHFESAAGYEIHGHALESEGNRKGAIDAFRHSRAIDPKRTGPGLAIGRLLLLEGQASEALSELQREMSLPSADPATHYYAGLAAIDLTRYDEAVTWLEKAASWSTRNPDASLALAQVYLALNQPAKAAEAARKALELNPASEAAREVLTAAGAR